MARKKGTHILLELWGCPRILLDDILFMKKVFENSCKDSGLKKLWMKFHKFNPHGLTGLALLSTSHISVHSWPEYNYVTIDIYACDDKEKVIKAAKIFVNELKPKRVKKTILKRGYIVK
ncbi:MAG: adenosylmethionine decarboxylase [Candidatus Aenigmarchaeota archaeon]|nr:adenosylmethionine decarboxylase [Candidatus Aenigmarchaeota archaeon]